MIVLGSRWVHFYCFLIVFHIVVPIVFQKKIIIFRNYSLRGTGGFTAVVVSLLAEKISLPTNDEN